MKVRVRREAEAVQGRGFLQEPIRGEARKGTPEGGSGEWNQNLNFPVSMLVLLWLFRT